MDTQPNLSRPRMLILGLQHMFAMFGATVVMPALTGLSVSSTLLFVGLGTLLFHCCTKGKVPAFLGASFSFLIGYWAIAPHGEKELLPYACLGVMGAGSIYLIVAGLIKLLGPQKVLRFVPPVVVGPIIISIGLTLAKPSIDNCGANPAIAILTAATVIICMVAGRQMIKLIPVIIGIVVSYTVAACFGQVDFSHVTAAPWWGLPFKMEDTVFGLLGRDHFDYGLLVSSILTIAPIALASVIEHMGDISAISSTVGQNFIKDPGLHRTLTGDGLATILAAMFGAPANTTYGENIGVLTITRVFDPRVVRLAAIFAIILAFCPKMAALIGAMPQATMGGISLVLSGMIAAVGVRTLCDAHIDFLQERNIIVVALILVLAVGINSTAAEALSLKIGSLAIKISGLAVGAVAGILANAILPAARPK